MNARNIIIWLIATFAAFVGVGLDRVCLGSLRFTPEVNLTDLLTLLVTIIIAYSIPTILQKSLNIKDFQKNQLIKKIEAILEGYKFIDKTYRECHLNQNLDAVAKTAIVSKFKEVSGEILIVIELVNLYFPVHMISRVNELKKQRTKFNRVITGGRFSTQNNIETLSSIKAGQVFHEINKNITHLLFEVNSL